MELEPKNFYKILAPRPAVLISTIDREGRANAAPFSFVMPVSTSPPLVAAAFAPGRHTLLNIRETKEFVVNIPPRKLLDRLWKCSKSFPRGTSEITESGLKERKSNIVKPVKIEGCIGWFECRLWDEKDVGDHVLVIGEVLGAEVEEGLMKDGNLDVEKAKPLMHIGGRDFAVPGEVINP